jgi:hypothetical protein
MLLKSSRHPLAVYWIGCLIVAPLAAWTAAHSSAAEDTVDQAVADLRQAGAEGSGFGEAIPAADTLRTVPVAQLPRLLDGLDSTNPVAENWFRGVVFDVARSGQPPSIEMLRDYAMDRSKNPLGRGLAMELILKQDAELASRLIANCLNDPSLPLREMAVEQAISQAEQLERSEQKQEAIDRYREALIAARHPRQLSRVVKALSELGQEVTTAQAFALLTDWQCVAPFNNVDGVGFDQSFPPEAEFADGGLDFADTYQGKQGDVRWRKLQDAGDEGVVNLADAYDKEKGAVAYLYTEFESSQPRPIQLRLGCINANKVWLNGKLVMSNEVYHSGSMLDQYIADAELVSGTNRILLKICQNEQTEPWAQEWEFQFRVTDPTGKGLVSGQ